VAAFEMPMHELVRYRGRNPAPSDLDAYWSAALAELERTRPEVGLEPNAFPAGFADCFDLWFTGVGGARVHAKYVRPRTDEGPHPALLHFHGYSMRSPDWARMLGWVGRGYSVAALDCRGQGGLSEDPGGVRGNTLNGHIIRGLDDAPEKLYYRQVFLDCARLAQVVMAFDEVDEGRVGATGASQGGGLTLACAALEPRVRLAAPIYPFLTDYQRVWEMDLAVRAYQELQDYFRRFDPRHERELEVFTRLGYVDVQHLAGRIRGDVLMITGLMDTVCPPSTQFAAFNRISAPKRHVLYPDFQHEDLPGADDIVYEFMGGL
jgi:cephalosporin-C deacetylase